MVALSDDPQRFDPGSQLLRSDGRALVVEGSHLHRGSRLLVKFEGVDSRDAAELIRGPVYVEESERRTLDDGEYWPEDLLGCRVVTLNGDDVGDVARVVEGPAQDLLEVNGGGGMFLVPLVKEVVIDVDVDGRRVTIDPPSGLVD